MTSKLATLTAVAALSLAPAAAFAQSAAPGSSATPPAASQTMPEPGSPAAPAGEMPSSTTTAPGKATTGTSATGMPAPGTSADATSSVVPATPKFVSAQSSGQWLGSELIGTEVVTSTDDNLGTISDLVMERDGSVIAAVIDVGGFLGIGAKPVAVSFESLTPTPTDNGQKIVVAMTKEELNAAPEFKTLEQMRDETAKTTTPPASTTN